MEAMTDLKSVGQLTVPVRIRSPVPQRMVLNRPFLHFYKNYDIIYMIKERRR